MRYLIGMFCHFRSEFFIELIEAFLGLCNVVDIPRFAYFFGDEVSVGGDLLDEGDDGFDVFFSEAQVAAELFVVEFAERSVEELAEGLAVLDGVPEFCECRGGYGVAVLGEDAGRLSEVDTSVLEAGLRERDIRSDTLVIGQATVRPLGRLRRLLRLRLLQRRRHRGLRVRVVRLSHFVLCAVFEHGFPPE